MTRLGVPGGPAGGRRGRCLGDRVTAYVDRAMDPETLLHWDRHLAVCDRCRAAVEEERRVLSALRSTAGASLECSSFDSAPSTNVEPTASSA